MVSVTPPLVFNTLGFPRGETNELGAVPGKLGKVERLRRPPTCFECESLPTVLGLLVGYMDSLRDHRPCGEKAVADAIN
jgi:hypothetical protein